MIDKKQLFLMGNRAMYCFADNLILCQELLNGGARIIQLRAKKIDDDTFFKIAKEMLLLMKNYEDSILIINDRVDIAIELKADGIHVGQEDENYRDVIERVPENMIVGVSVESVKQAVEAEQAGATYVGPGSVFTTPTKSDVAVIGLEGLSQIVQAVKIPVVAIGGITIENIRQVMATGVHYYAVISQINDAQDISARLNEFFKIIASHKI